MLSISVHTSSTSRSATSLAALEALFVTNATGIPAFMSVLSVVTARSIGCEPAYTTPSRSHSRPSYPLKTSSRTNFRRLEHLFPLWKLPEV